MTTKVTLEQAIAILKFSDGVFDIANYLPQLLAGLDDAASRLRVLEAKANLLDHPVGKPT